MRLKILKLIYDELKYKIVLNNKKVINNSVYLTFIKLRSNEKYEFLNYSSVPRYKIPNEIFEELTQHSYIRESDEKLDHYIFTGIGLFEYEKKLGIINDLSLVSYLHKTNFIFPVTKKSLNHKEKVILLSMIGARIYSEDVPMNLNEEIIMDSWKIIFQKSDEFLRNTLYKKT